jgi:hypothetical protein
MYKEDATFLLDSYSILTTEDDSSGTTHSTEERCVDRTIWSMLDERNYLQSRQ